MCYRKSIHSDGSVVQLCFVLLIIQKSIIMSAVPVGNPVVFSAILLKQLGSSKWMSVFTEPKWCEEKLRKLTIG